MKKLITIFSLIFFISGGIVYADDYGVNSNASAIAFSELQGHNYNTMVISQNPIAPFPLPLFTVTVFSFEESGNFICALMHEIGENYSGSYTQTESTFTAQIAFELLNFFFEVNFKGTFDLDRYIYGNLTGKSISARDSVNFTGVFFGVSQWAKQEEE